MPSLDPSPVRSVLKPGSSTQIRCAVLPLYLALYDRRRPAMRDGFTTLLQRLATHCLEQDIAVSIAKPCTEAQEIKAVVAQSEEDQVDALIIVHLAYSPSLEAADALCSTHLPLILFDTSCDFSFAPGIDPQRISYNHGIHGVQDLASVLHRRSRSFTIIAGHVDDRQAYHRMLSATKANQAAQRFVNSKSLRIGKPFPNMGDFAVGDELLASRFGIQVDQYPPERLLAQDSPPMPTIHRFREELADQADVMVDAEELSLSLHTGLQLQALLEAGNYLSFSLDFTAFTKQQSSLTVPFLQASLLMAQGVGYAGEGDNLTAQLLAAFAPSWPQATFTEMFCPDWQGNRIFCSHMGEVNTNCLTRPWQIVCKDNPFIDCPRPATVAGRLQAGTARLINILLGPDDFEIIHAAVAVDASGHDVGMESNIRGWMRPQHQTIGPFLEQWSVAGGTHHCILVYDLSAEAVEVFARTLKLVCKEIA